MTKDADILWAVRFAPKKKQKHPVFDWIEWEKYLASNECTLYFGESSKRAKTNDDVREFALESTQSKKYIPLGSMLHKALSSFRLCDKCVLRARRLNNLVARGKIFCNVQK